MQVSIDDFVQDPVKYVDLAKDEEIMFSRNGENIARLSSPETPRSKALKEILKLRGILSSDTSLEKIREERLMERYGKL